MYKNTVGVQRFEICEENAHVNLYFLWQNIGGNGMFTGCVFKTLLPGQILMSR